MVPVQQSPLPVNFEGVPDALKEIPHWVLWVAGKRPVQPSGQPARVNDAATWYSYDEVVSRYLDGGFYGVGFVLTEALGITAIDWDDCADGELPRDSLTPYLDSLNSFTERSPSGTGLHTWVFGVKPGPRSKVSAPLPGVKAIEIYGDARFMTITGHTLDGYPAGLESRQNELESIYYDFFPKSEVVESPLADIPTRPLSDGDLLRTIRNSHKGSSFEALFDRGDTSAYDGDRSAADMALCNILAFWSSRDSSQIDRLFRESRLMRPKWDEQRGAATYGEITIAEAVRGTTEVYCAKVKYTSEQLSEMIEANDEPFELMGRVAGALNDSDLSSSQEHYLRKRIAKKSGTTIKALEADAAKQQPARDKPRSQIDLAKEVKASFGDDNLIHAAGGFYRWQPTGVWKDIDDQSVKQRVHQAANDDEITGNNVDSVLKLVRTESFVSDVSFGKPFDGINCLSGELHHSPHGWVASPHKRDRYLLSQVPIKYDQDANAPRFEQFLDEIFAGDTDALEKRELVLELMGYTLLPSCRYEKFVILIGSGANGKSVLLDLVKELCGVSNVAAVAPDKLDNSFHRAHLHGKYANLVTELAEGAVINDAALKSITSGELTTAEHKFRPPFNFSPYATCWFGSNHMPHTRDFSDALFRRACVITFNNKFEGSNCDPLLKEKLLDELPGVLRMALDGLSRVLATGQFTEPKSMLEARLDWRQEADQVSQFVEDCCHIGIGRTAVGLVYKRYKDWAAENGLHRTLSNKSFTKRLLRIEGVDNKKSGSVRSYTGLTLIGSRTSGGVGT